MDPFRPPATGAGPASILLVDDDPLLREFACVHLATPDVMLDTAVSGAEALERIETGGFDLVLVGGAMPDMGAAAFITALRQSERAPIPAVVVTDGDNPEEIDAAFVAGATSFLVKPLNPRIFPQQLRFILRDWKQEQEVRAAHARVAQAHSVKANVLRLVQHELRTPLTSIVGFAEHIQAHPRASNVAEFATFIADAGRRFSQQVDDLIVAARILTDDLVLDPDDCRVSQILQGVAQHAGATADGLRVRDATGDARLACDRDLLVRALRNLVQNAIQHGASPVDFVATVEGPHIVFAVRDRGPGIPSGSLEPSFEAFQQSEDALNRGAVGLGLGLPVARRILEAHGGTLRACSVADDGFVALAVVPAAQRNAA